LNSRIASSSSRTSSPASASSPGPGRSVTRRARAASRGGPAPRPRRRPGGVPRRERVPRRRRVPARGPVLRRAGVPPGLLGQLGLDHLLGAHPLERGRQPPDLALARPGHPCRTIGERVGQSQIAVTLVHTHLMPLDEITGRRISACSRSKGEWISTLAKHLVRSSQRPCRLAQLLRASPSERPPPIRESVGRRRRAVFRPASGFFPRCPIPE
jgi:hypothetical protein